MSRFGVRVYKSYFNFASSHFLIFSDGGREELHGHNYQVRAKVTGEIADADMVVDFCKLKPIVRRECDALDHRVLLPERNDRLAVREEEGHVEARFERTDGGVDRFTFPARDVILLPIANTSTERLAELLAGRVLAGIREEVPVARLHRLEVEVEETGGQCGVYETDVED